MKLLNKINAKNRFAIGATILTATSVYAVAVPESAPSVISTNQPELAAKPERSYTGTVIAVDPKERILTVKEWALSKKTFNLGDNCAYALLFTSVANNHGQANDLRPGEKITVSYQDSHGVLIADRINQRAVRFEGAVAVIEPDKHKLILHRRGLDKELTIGADCIVVLRGQKPGSLMDIHTGNHVTVTYETPGGMPTAREILQTSQIFTGTLTAIDLGEKTVKAKGLLDFKQFNVPDDCAIVINDKLNGKLSDLKPNDRLVFNFDEINGVNVVSRIGAAPAEPQPKGNMMSTSPAYPGYRLGY